MKLGDPRIVNMSPTGPTFAHPPRGVCIDCQSTMAALCWSSELLT